MIQENGKTHVRVFLLFRYFYFYFYFFSSLCLSVGLCNVICITRQITDITRVVRTPTGIDFSFVLRRLETGCVS